MLVVGSKSIVKQINLLRPRFEIKIKNQVMLTMTKENSLDRFILKNEIKSQTKIFIKIVYGIVVNIFFFH